MAVDVTEVGEELAGRVVIVTGAGKGLGRAYAHELAARGATVICNNRRHTRDTVHSADKVVAEITALGGHATANYGAAEDESTGPALLEQALTHCGRLDAVIANAGVSEAKTFHKHDAASIRRILDINLMGTIYLLLPLFRHLYAQGAGAVLTSTSAAGLYAEHGLPAYSAAKAGLIGLTKSLALEGAAHGVRVNALAPFAETPMTSDSLPPELRERLPPEAVAPLAAYLVSDRCTLNGEVLIAGGKRLARAVTHTTDTVPLGGKDPARQFAHLERLLANLLAQPAQRVHRSANTLFAEHFTAGE